MTGNWKQITNSPIEATKRKKLIKSFVHDLSVAASTPEELESRIEGVKASHLAALIGQDGDPDFFWMAAAVHMLTDLAYQRWSIKFERGHIFVLRPEEEEGREGLRIRLLSRRNRQLREASVRQFIASMEK